MKTKSLLILSLFILSIATLSAQPPVGINYQAALYNENNEPMADQNVTVTFSILEDSESGSSVYEEEHSATTSNTGLVNVVIGDGSSLSGSFSSIDWANHAYYVNVSVDGTDMGTFPFQNVPYSKVATNMSLENLQDVASTAPSSGQVIKWNGSEWAPADVSSNSSLWQESGDDIVYDAGKVFINRNNDITGDEYFGVSSPTTGNSYGGMYINTDSETGRPFYGYATNGIERAWTYWDGADSTFKLYNNTMGLAINQDGFVGIGTSEPAYDMHVQGDLFVNSIHGAFRIGNPEGDDAWQFVTTNAGTDLLLYEEYSGGGNERRLILEQEGFFEVTHSDAGGNNEGFKISNWGNNNNNWSLYTSNANGNLYLFENGNLMGNFDEATGGYSASSDKKLKKDIQELGPVLSDINKLPVKKYRFKKQSDDGDLSIGLIAQDVQPLFPELVTQMNSEEGNETLGLNYSGFGVIAIKAIQEQQEIIDKQQSTIDDLIKRVEQLEEQINQ